MCQGALSDMGKNNKSLSTRYILKVMQLFNQKNWKIEDSEEENTSLFNRYCERMLEVGENKKRELMLALTERYLWIPQEEYIDYLVDALIKLFEANEDINENEKIYVMPLVTPNDIGKIKSSMAISYMFNNVKIRYNSKLAKYKFQIESDIDRLRDLMQEESILILVDDFIGTGETAQKCILNLQEKGILLNRTIILSLVAQQQGVENLQIFNVPVFSSRILQRGISDYYEGEELKENIKLMQEIESKLHVKKEFLFGYHASEALVTMCRTPNNTFPLFWEEKGHMGMAPFPRH